MAGPGLTMAGRFTVSEEHQGAPGLVHGGLLAAAFDEVLGACNWLLLSPAVTGNLSVDFRKPVPVGQTVLIDARIDAIEGRKVQHPGSGDSPTERPWPRPPACSSRFRWSTTANRVAAVTSARWRRN